VSRQAFTFDTMVVDGMEMVDPDSIVLGEELPVDANQRGWKDTVQVHPGETVRVIAKFDKEGLYVWHCHILSHEDNEMMRPYYVGPIPDDVLDRYDGVGHTGMSVARSMFIDSPAYLATGPRRDEGDYLRMVADLLEAQPLRLWR
jgi:hypothetical protein